MSGPCRSDADVGGRTGPPEKVREGRALSLAGEPAPGMAMFAAMVKWYSTVVLTLLLGACGAPGVPDQEHAAPPADTNWIGDLRVTAQDTTVRVCGTGRRYRLSGPAADTLSQRYAYAVAMKGQWAKAWFRGHLGTLVDGNHTDSVLWAVQYHHLDASLQCDPVPDVRIAGRYQLTSTDTEHPRSVHMDLFADGEVTMYTLLPGGEEPLEEDGQWGVDAQEQVLVKWPKRDHTMRWRWTGERLESERMSNGAAVSMERTGAADRQAGMYGRTVRWLAQAATAAGRPTEVAEIKGSTLLSDLFTTPEARKNLDAAAADSLALKDENLLIRWSGVTTVRQVVELMRSTAGR